MQSENPVRLLRIDEVQRRVGLRRTAIYQRIKDGAFPRAVPLTATARAWREDEVSAWIAARIALRDAGRAA